MVLVLLAIPLTWRRVLLVAAMIAGFALLLPLAVVRRFYELDLPHGYLGTALVIAAAGAAALTAVWLFLRPRGRGANSGHPSSQPVRPTSASARSSLSRVSPARDR